MTAAQRTVRHKCYSQQAGIAVISAAMLLLWLGLSAAVAWLWLNPPQPQTVDLSQITDADAAAEAIVGEPLATIDLRPLNNYQEIVERPLFYQARRPPEPDREPAQAPEPPPPEEEVELTLIGIMVVGDDRSALIKNETTGKTVVVKQGDSFDSWELGAVATDRVLLAKNGDYKELKLIRNKRQPSQKITQQVERLKEARRLAAERREQLRQQRLQPDGEPPPEEQLADNTGEETEQPSDNAEEQPSPEEQGEGESEGNPELEETTETTETTEGDTGAEANNSDNNDGGARADRTRPDRTRPDRTRPDRTRPTDG